MRKALQRVILLLICWLNCVIASSQTNIRELIWDTYHSSISLSEEAEIVEKIKPLKLLSGDLVNSQSDSIQYLYHYCLAALYDLEDNEVESLHHIDIALQLREKSIGIKDAEYLELLCSKADILKELEPTKAMKIYQKAYVVGQSLLRSKDDVIIYWYGQCLWNLGDMYIKRNYVQQVISLYKDAFQLTSKYFDVPSISILCIAPLQQLEDFYYSRKEYDKAVSICDDLLSFLTQHDAQTTEHYARMLCFKAASLEKMGNLGEAISCYEKSIAIEKNLLQPENSTTAYGNLHLLYLKQNLFEKADSLEKEYIPILLQGDDLEKIVAQYYAASYILLEKRILEKSEAYIDKCFPLIDRIEPSTKELIYSRKSLLRFRVDDVESALKYKALAINCSSTDIRRINNQIDRAYLTSLKDPVKSIEEYSHILREMETLNYDTIPLYTSALKPIDIYYSSDSFKKGIAFIEDILQRFADKYGEIHSTYALLMNMRGLGYLKLDEASQALPILMRTKDIYDALQYQQTMDYATVLHNIGRAYMLLQNNAEALLYLEKSKTMQIQLTGKVLEKTKESIDTINRMGE